MGRFRGFWNHAIPLLICPGQPGLLDGTGPYHSCGFHRTQTVAQPQNGGWLYQWIVKRKSIFTVIEKTYFWSSLYLGFRFAQTQDYYLQCTGNSWRSTRKKTRNPMEKWAMDKLGNHRREIRRAGKCVKICSTLEAFWVMQIKTWYHFASLDWQKLDKSYITYQVLARMWGKRNHCW